MPNTPKTKRQKTDAPSQRGAARSARGKRNRPASLSEVLDAAEQLDSESQTELVAILNRRLAERGRNRVVVDVQQARREFAEGQCERKTAAEIVREALS